MRTWTVTACGVEPGLPWLPDPYPHVPVGEAGRGRHLNRFPVARRFAAGLASDRLDRVDVIRTAARGTLLLVEEQAPSSRALVLLDVAAGFRGTTVVTGVSYTEGPCPDADHPSLQAACWTCRQALEWDGLGYAHPAAATVRTYDPLPAGVTILAAGRRAQGQAGRMGNHPVLLLLLAPCTRFRVERHGRLYGAPAELIVAWDGTILRCAPPDCLDDPTQEEPVGIRL